jgi:hypothetical protein
MRDLTVEFMVEKLLEEEQQIWELYKKAVEENGGHEGSMLSRKYKYQHEAIMNILDEFELNHK